MIQRIQSIYLLLSALVLGVLFFVPIAQCVDKGQVDQAMYSIGMYKVYFQGAPVQASVSSLLLASSTALAMLLPVLSIFKYSNRKLQLKWLKASKYMLAILLLAAYFFIDANVQALPAGRFQRGFTWAAYAPIAAMFLQMLAAMAIRKDEKLVQSVDRLR